MVGRWSRLVARFFLPRIIFEVSTNYHGFTLKMSVNKCTGCGGMHPRPGGSMCKNLKLGMGCGNTHISHDNDQGAAANPTSVFRRAEECTGSFRPYVFGPL